MIKDLVKMVCRGKSYALFVVGEGGWGKSYDTIKTIREEKVKFVYINSFSTPLALYNLLYKYKDGYLILLDDVYGLWEDPKAVSILKAATWPIDNGERILTYQTNKKSEIPSEFKFNSGVIILANKLNVKDPNIRALTSRALYYEMYPSFEDKIRLMKKIAEDAGYKELTKEQRLMIFDTLMKHITPAVENFNLRLLIKAFDFYLYDKEKYDEMIKKTIKINPEVQLIYEMRDLKVKDQVAKWIKLTGKSRATYFTTKKLL